MPFPRAFYSQHTVCVFACGFEITKVQLLLGNTHSHTQLLLIYQSHLACPNKFTRDQQKVWIGSRAPLAIH